MTKVRVTAMFHDRADYGIVYEVGKVYDFFGEERVRSIVERGLGVIVEAEQQKVQEQDVKPKTVVQEAEEPKAEAVEEEPKAEAPKKKPATKKKARK